MSLQNLHNGTVLIDKNLVTHIQIQKLPLCSPFPRDGWCAPIHFQGFCCNQAFLSDIVLITLGLLTGKYGSSVYTSAESKGSSGWLSPKWFSALPLLILRLAFIIGIKFSRGKDGSKVIWTQQKHFWESKKHYNWALHLLTKPRSQ